MGHTAGGSLTTTPTVSTDSAASLSPTHTTSSAAAAVTTTREEDLQRCYTGQDRLVRPSDMKGAALSVPPIVSRVYGALFGISPPPTPAPASELTTPTTSTMEAAHVTTEVTATTVTAESITVEPDMSRMDQTHTMTAGAGMGADMGTEAMRAVQTVQSGYDDDHIPSAGGGLIPPPPAAPATAKRLTFKGPTPTPPPAAPGPGYTENMLSSASDGSGSIEGGVAALSLTDFGDDDGGNVFGEGASIPPSPAPETPDTPVNNTWKHVGSDCFPSDVNPTPPPPPPPPLPL